MNQVRQTLATEYRIIGDGVSTETTINHNLNLSDEELPTSSILIVATDGEPCVVTIQQRAKNFIKLTHVPLSSLLWVRIVKEVVL